MNAPAPAAPPLPVTGLASAAALLLEGKAAFEFLQSAQAGGLPLPPLLLMHLVACSLLAYVLRHRRRAGGPDGRFAAFVFVFCLALPLLGMLGVLLGALPALGGRPPAKRAGYGIIPREPPRGWAPGYPARYGPGGFRARLLARRIPASLRLPGLLALRRRASPPGNLLLKEMLRDPADELRLAAYAALESRERESQAAIASAAAALAQAAAARDEAARLAALRRLAGLRWEAVYQELAEGELSRHQLEQALETAEAALETAPGDGSLLLLKGRILLRLGRWDEASTALGPPAGPDLPATRILPWRAEFAFLRRDFAAVRAHLAALRGKAAGGKLDGILRSWLGREGAA